MFNILLKNKKGFTLIEIIATVAIMAIIAGIATPSVYYSTQRKQKSAAEYDTQTMYRNCISCISDLAALYVTPEKPWGRNSLQIAEDNEDKIIDLAVSESYGFPEGQNVFYVGFGDALAAKIYQTIVALDINVYYFDATKIHQIGNADANPKVLLSSPKKADGSDYFANERSTFVTAGNKNPYIVIQIKKIITGDSYYNLLIVSYHNDKYGFNFKLDNPDNPYNAYTTNKGIPICYTYKIRG